MSKNKKEVEAIESAMGVFTAIISNLVELVKKFGGTMENIYHLATPEGKETLEAIAKIIVGGINKAKNEFLKLISSDKALELDAVDGAETLAEANDVFKAGIDSDFKNLGLNKRSSKTGKTLVEVYEMIKGGTFLQIFSSLFGTSPVRQHVHDLRKLCFTQAQIKNFVVKHRNQLRREGYGTFFLFEDGDSGNFFVAYVSFHSDDELKVYVIRLENGTFWRVGHRHRVVVPQPA
jgi:hypothetical protein